MTYGQQPGYGPGLNRPAHSPLGGSRGAGTPSGGIPGYGEAPTAFAASNRANPPYGGQPSYGAHNGGPGHGGPGYGQGGGSGPGQPGGQGYGQSGGQGYGQPGGQGYGQPGGSGYGQPGGPGYGQGAPQHEGRPPYGQPRADPRYGGPPAHPHYGPPSAEQPPKSKRRRADLPTGGLVTDEDERWAVPAYVGLFVGGFVAPAIVYAVKGRSSSFARFHAAQALNLFIAMSVCNFLAFYLAYRIGVTGLMVALVVMAAEAFCIVKAAIGANRCEWYRIPSIIAWPIVR